MSSVFKVVRDDGAFRQHAALKTLQFGQDSPQARDRFRQERQFLATLEHPAIARLIDGGTTPRGRPYLVMEFVDGQRIDLVYNRLVDFALEEPRHAALRAAYDKLRKQSGGKLSAVIIDLRDKTGAAWDIRCSLFDELGGDAALGAGDDLAHSSIRFGLGRWTTEEEVDYVIEKLTSVVRRLREMSPLYEMVKEGIDLNSMQWVAH